MSTMRYPVPKEVGGQMIRQLISHLKRQAGLSLPITSHILIACSGGQDSVALARLIARFGKRVVSKELCTLAHVNHGWRGVESDGDEIFVQNLAQELGTGFLKYRARVLPSQGESPENHARSIRIQALERMARKLGPDTLIFSAHQADDLAETMLWRLFTGAFPTHRRGILPQHGRWVRPLLPFRRSQVRAFLEEEGQTWREDRSNLDPRFLRVKVRVRLLPVIESIFPKAVEHLIALSRSGDGLPPDRGLGSDAAQILQKALGGRYRRSHVEAVDRLLKSAQSVSLPKGWQLGLTKSNSSK